MRAVAHVVRPVCFAGVVVFSAPLAAQDLAKRVISSDGVVNVIYPSRKSACGDGRSFMGNILGTDRMYSGNVVWNGRDDDRWRVCVHGPARVAATVLDGEVTRLRVFVGPVPTPPPDARTITASPIEAVAWLSGLASRGSSRVGSDAIVPIVLADAPDPWPFLLGLARDEDRPRNVRQSALFWLSNAVNDHLGISNADAHASDDDEIRAQAVFALSQRPKGESVPDLIDVARTTRSAAARKAAIFWLSQSGDRRAADLYAELLGIR
jgi:hypothetical protein